MADNLNELIDKLQSTFDGVQESIGDQQATKICRQFNVDKNGKVKSLTWSFCTTLDDKKERTYELIQIPLHNLYSNDSLHVSEFSVELDCNVVEKTNNKRSDKEKSDTKKNRKIKISLRKDDSEMGTQTEIFLDDVLLDKNDALLNEAIDIDLDNQEINKKKLNRSNSSTMSNASKYFVALTISGLVATSVLVLSQKIDKVALVNAAERVFHDIADNIKTYVKGK